MSNESTTASYTVLGTVCTLSNEILAKWYSLGAQKGVLGYPIEEEITYKDNACSVRFQKGSIYSHPEYGTYYITGKFYRYWADQLGVYGPYGFPVSDPYGTSGDTEQEFAGGKLNSGQPEICDCSDLRGEIIRREIDIRMQGKRPTCSVQTMVFLMEYQYSGLLGREYRHLSVEYANHFANVAKNLQQDGHYFSSVAAGYQEFGIVKDFVWPYNKDWEYNFEQGCHLAGDDMICLGKRLLQPGLCLKGRFVKELGIAGLTEEQFSEIIALLDEGIPVGIGRDHSLALVGYRKNEKQPGGGIMIFRNSYGTNKYFTGYQTETFEHVKQTVYDAYVYECSENV